MMKLITGGCNCGKVRYEVSSQQDKAYYCHCSDCRKAMGNIFATFISIPKETLHWINEQPKYFKSSKDVLRGFCGDCGTPLSYEKVDTKNMDLTVGSLDSPEAFKPVGHTGFGVYEQRLFSIRTKPLNHTASFNSSL